MPLDGPARRLSRPLPSPEGGTAREPICDPLSDDRCTDFTACDRCPRGDDQ